MSQESNNAKWLDWSLLYVPASFTSTGCFLTSYTILRRKKNYNPVKDQQKTLSDFQQYDWWIFSTSRPLPWQQIKGLSLSKNRSTFPWENFCDKLIFDKLAIVNSLVYNIASVHLQTQQAKKNAWENFGWFFLLPAFCWFETLTLGQALAPSLIPSLIPAGQGWNSSIWISFLCLSFFLLLSSSFFS